MSFIYIGGMPRFRSDLRQKRLALCIMARMRKGVSVRKASDVYKISHSLFVIYCEKFNLLAQYASAKEDMHDAMAEQIMEVALEPIRPLEDGKIDPSLMKQKQIVIDSLKWTLGKVSKKYSEKKELLLSGEVTQNTRIIKSFDER